MHNSRDGLRGRGRQCRGSGHRRRPIICVNVPIRMLGCTRWPIGDLRTGM